MVHLADISTSSSCVAARCVSFARLFERSKHFHVFTLRSPTKFRALNSGSKKRARGQEQQRKRTSGSVKKVEC